MSGPTEGWQVPKGYGKTTAQWGAYAPPQYQPIFLVPRPPRPSVVTIAIGLSYLGVAVAGLQFVVFLVQLATSGTMSAPGVSSQNSGPEPGIGTAAGVIGMVITALIFLVPAGGTVVTAIFAQRGANAARIVLASLMGFFAVANLCLGAAAAFTAADDRGVSQVSPLTVAVEVVEFGLAVAVGVLLLVPAANRYFSAGPGRRFVTGITPVGSTHDQT